MCDLFKWESTELEELDFFKFDTNFCDHFPEQILDGGDIGDGFWDFDE